jgi:mannose-6-phosphate isomerase-like protein (cupin superfamily)
MQIEHWDSERDGQLSEAAMRAKLEYRGYDVTRYIYPPGTFFPPHDHGVDKIDGVLAGRFRMTMQDREVVLEAGDLLVVPKHVMHTAEVVGEEAVVSLDAVKMRP